VATDIGIMIVFFEFLSFLRRSTKLARLFPSNHTSLTDSNQLLANSQLDEASDKVIQNDSLRRRQEVVDKGTITHEPIRRKTLNRLVMTSTQMAFAFYVTTLASKLQDALRLPGISVALSTLVAVGVEKCLDFRTIGTIIGIRPLNASDLGSIRVAATPTPYDMPDYGSVAYGSGSRNGIGSGSGGDAVSEASRRCFSQSCQDGSKYLLAVFYCVLGFKTRIQDVVALGAPIIALFSTLLFVHVGVRHEANNKIVSNHVFFQNYSVSNHVTNNFIPSQPMFPAKIFHLRPLYPNNCSV
jgi:hypothetical protein